MIGVSNIGIPVQMADAYAYYSIPAMDVKIPPILIVYGIVMPPLAAIVVNFFVIRKKLSQTALSLIKMRLSSQRVAMLISETWDLSEDSESDRCSER